MATLRDPSLTHQVIVLKNGPRWETRVPDLQDSDITVSCNCLAQRTVSGTQHRRMGLAHDLVTLRSTYNDPELHNPRVRALREDEMLRG